MACTQDTYNEADGPNPKLISPWRGPYTVRAQLSPVIYRVTKDGNPAEITVHLGRMKKYVVPRSPPVPDVDALDDLFLGTTLSVPDLEGSLSKGMIGAFTVESIDGHERGVGATSLTNFQYHLKLHGIPPRRVYGVMSTPSLDAEKLLLPTVLLYLSLIHI